MYDYDKINYLLIFSAGNEVAVLTVLSILHWLPYPDLSGQFSSGCTAVKSAVNVSMTRSWFLAQESIISMGLACDATLVYQPGYVGSASLPEFEPVFSIISTSELMS